MEIKQCSKCEETKPVSGFHKNASRKDGLYSWCKECQRQYRQRPERKEYDRQYRQRPEMKESHQQYCQQYFQNLRSQIIQLYGGQCLGCGNPHLDFLEIDHILGGGCQHVKECGGNRRMYKAILAEGYRPDKYRVLCKVCNQLARWFSIEEVQAIFKPLRYPDSSQQVYKKE